MNVVVVEDDEDVRTVFTLTLRDAGFVVTEAGTCEEGLAAIARERPALVLLDLGMPAGCMPGIEFLAQLRDAPATAGMPVVIVSGLGESVNPDVTERLRVSATLTKPVSPALLLRVVRDALGGRGADARPL